ncbi:MAG: hypothetical protein AB7U29_17905 [Desulfobulbus sp.]
MQIASMSQNNSANQSVLKTANQQPRLAADLISKTVESLMQTQSMPTPAQPVTQSNGIVPGSTFNITA